MKTLWNPRNLILVFLGFFHTYSYAEFNYRPYYAQMSNLAYAQSLGYVAGILPYETSSIMQTPSFLSKVENPILIGGYGSSQYTANSLDIAYVSIFGDDSNFIFGLEYLINFIPSGKIINNEYFSGKMDHLGFEQVLAAAAAYSFGSNGTFGVNLKLPMNSYKKTIVDGGFLIAASYNIDFFGFNFMVGLANIGAMYVNQNLRGVYPDIQAGISYGYKDNNGESIFDIGFNIENNLGELINNSFIFGMGGRIRVFSTGLLKSKPLIKDDILQTRDNRQQKKNFQDTLADIQSMIYLNVGFQFSNDSHFSIGITSLIDNYLVDIGFIFPSAITKRFGVYVSVGSTL